MLQLSQHEEEGESRLKRVLMSQCQYDESNQNETCRRCRQKNLQCGDKIFALEFKTRQSLKKRLRGASNSSPAIENLRWTQIKNGKLSDLVLFLESRYPGTMTEPMLPRLSQVMSNLRSSAGQI